MPSLCTESKAILHAGGFNLRKFNTNSSRLQERIYQEENFESTSTLHSDETYSQTMLGGAYSMAAGEHKTLGVKWCTETDHFILDVSEVGHQASSLTPTKRHIVSLVGRIYDPLGFLSPVVIRLKSLFQELCSFRLRWDEPLTGAPLMKWQSMMTDLQTAQQIRIPRFLLCDIHHQVQSYSLIGFCDASKKAYAAVVYLRVKILDRFYVNFLASKTRVNPPETTDHPKTRTLIRSAIGKIVTQCEEGTGAKTSFI